MTVPAGTESEAHTNVASSVAALEDQLSKSLFRTLTLNDRCDADSAEAAVAQVVLADGSELLFCGHHWRKNEAALAKFPHSVPDEESKPMTWRRASELGHVSRAVGDDHA